MAGELLAAVKIYNFVPDESAESYRAALLREYARFCGGKGTR
jgi:hypothetical protein